MNFPFLNSLSISSSINHAIGYLLFYIKNSMYFGQSKDAFSFFSLSF